MNWSQKPNDILWMLLAFLRLSLMALTLLSWTMDRNAFTPFLSQQRLPGLGWVYFLALSLQAVLMYGSYWEERCACQS